MSSQTLTLTRPADQHPVSSSPSKVKLSPPSLPSLYPTATLNPLPRYKHLPRRYRTLPPPNRHRPRLSPMDDPPLRPPSLRILHRRPRRPNALAPRPRRRRPCPPVSLSPCPHPQAHAFPLPITHSPRGKFQHRRRDAPRFSLPGPYKGSYGVCAGGRRGDVYG